jgi:hypothetical protein
MERPELKQFAQRVTVDFHLQALTRRETHAYVRHRLTVAGGSDSIFQDRAIDFIHERSGGIPRLMNQLCDLSLVYAFAEGRQRVSSALCLKVLKDRSSGKASPLFGEVVDIPSDESADEEEDEEQGAPTSADDGRIAGRDDLLEGHA